jgi:LysR family transcriptional regulator, low CO2-responsive transcriptional regulator
MAVVLKLEWLQAFAAFAEHLSFTRAAKALHLSQPALHVQVKKLSEALGVTLYRREGQRLLLTADGQRVAAFGREVQDRTRELADDLAAGGRTAPVVLCAGEGAYLYLLGEGIRRFLREGGAPLKLLTRGREGTIEAVRGGEAHVGVAALDVLPDGLDARPLADVGQALVLPESHPLAAKRKVRLADLTGARLVVPGPDRPHRATLARALLEAGVPWEVAVEADGWELMLRFVELGVGLAIVNACCRLPSGLTAKPLPELPRQRYYVLLRPGTRARGAADALAGMLVAAGAPWRAAGT